MAFDNNFIDDLKSKVNIVDVIGRDVKLKRAGSNFKGLCPFHTEKTPSFIVSEQKQLFNCFGCGEKGDVIKFVQRYYNLPFMEAVEKLCEDNGIEMPERNYGPKIDYDKFYEINRKAARFYYDKLTKTTNKGYQYIRRRGLSDSTIVKFGLGYAPDSWTELYEYLKSQGVSEEDMLTLGLIIKGKNGYYDKYRDRVMFPIFNTNGKVIGFGGRAIGDAMPKYLNSSESDIFLKKNNLYGLNFTKKDVADEGRIILVEGYMDMISLWQNGVKNVAASLGTSLTEGQGRLISRYTKNAVLSYDSDSAGVSAAVRGIDILRQAGCNVRILRVSDGKDPDEYIRKHGKEAFLKLVDEATPAVDFRLEILRTGYDLTDELQIIDYIRHTVPVLKGLQPVEQDVYIKKLAAEFGLSETAIRNEIREESERDSALAASEARRRSEPRNRGNSTDALRLELSFIVLVSEYPQYLQRLKKDGIVFRTAAGEKYAAAIEGALTGNDSRNEFKQRILDALDPDEEALFRNAVKNIRIGPDEEEFYSECKASYMLDVMKEKRAELLNELSVAETIGDSERVGALAQGLMEIDEAILKMRKDQ